MRLQMRSVDHDPLGLAAPARQFGEDLVEHAQPAPADEPIVDRLVRAVFARRVAPSPFLITNTMALTIRRSSTRAIPCDSGKNPSIRRICARVNMRRCRNHSSPLGLVNQISGCIVIDPMAWSRALSSDSGGSRTLRDGPWRPIPLCHAETVVSPQAKAIPRPLVAAIPANAPGPDPRDFTCGVGRVNDVPAAAWPPRKICWL